MWAVSQDMALIFYSKSFAFLDHLTKQLYYGRLETMRNGHHKDDWKTPSCHKREKEFFPYKAI